MKRIRRAQLKKGNRGLINEGHKCMELTQARSVDKTKTETNQLFEEVRYHIGII